MALKGSVNLPSFQQIGANKGWGECLLWSSATNMVWNYYKCYQGYRIFTLGDFTRDTRVFYVLYFMWRSCNKQIKIDKLKRVSIIVLENIVGVVFFPPFVWTGEKACGVLYYYICFLLLQILDAYLEMSWIFIDNSLGRCLSPLCGLYDMRHKNKRIPDLVLFVKLKSIPDQATKVYTILPRHLRVVIF